MQWSSGPAALLVLVGACGTVDLGAPPADVNACRPSEAYFASDIWPKVLAKDYGGKHCYDSRCHDAASARPLVLAPPDGPPMVPLSREWEAIYRSTADQLFCTNVSGSPLLAKPDGQLTHGGQKLFEPDGPEALTVIGWVKAP